MKKKIKELIIANRKLKKQNVQLKEQNIELKKINEKLIDQYNFVRSELRKTKLERKTDENIL